MLQQDQYNQPDYCMRNPPAKVKMQVFYESYSDQSKRFFTDQFKSWYTYIEEMAAVELYPAGNTIEHGHSDGTCDSYLKNSACVGNKIQALVIDKYLKHAPESDHVDGATRTMLFLNCFFGYANYSSDVYTAAEYCVGKTLSSEEKWFDLLSMITSNDGARVYKEVLDATAKFKTDHKLASFDSLPWITLGGAHSKQTVYELLPTVCTNYQVSRSTIY